LPIDTAYRPHDGSVRSVISVAHIARSHSYAEAVIISPSLKNLATFDALEVHPISSGMHAGASNGPSDAAIPQLLAATIAPTPSA
jgi:hypothetical protein